MGLLDDAIREHLDLKRRRGADPAEIERAEREALGPVRREPIASEDGGDLAESGVDSGHAVSPDHEPAPTAGEAYGTGSDEEPGHDEGWDDYEDDEEPELGHAEAPGHASGAPEVRPESPARTAPPDDDLEATQAHRIEPIPDGPEDGSEDVLEETPDFLQDTPDHDRLWFEQRPPKDFDFDE